MKVDRTQRRRAREVVTAEKERKKDVRAAASVPFLDHFLVKRRTDIRGELDSLIRQIDEQAQLIEKSLTFETLETYRTLVQKFVHIAIHELYEVEEKLSVSKTGKQKALVIVKKINTALEELTSEFLGRQVNLINFMGRIDQIRGLLIDLYS
ncbi:MAG: YaaR family protein [bacterium]